MVSVLWTCGFVPPHWHFEGCGLQSLTFARLGETRDGSDFRLLIATGEGLDTDLFVRGNPLNVRFDAGCDALRKEILDNGWEHHFSMAYGDLTEELLALGRAWNIETTIVR